MHAEGDEAGETDAQADLVRIAGGEKTKIVHPKATTGIMSSEAVEEKGVWGWGGGEKNGFAFKIFV